MILQFKYSLIGFEFSLNKTLFIYLNNISCCLVINHKKFLVAIEFYFFFYSLRFSFLFQDPRFLAFCSDSQCASGWTIFQTCAKDHIRKYLLHLTCQLHRIKHRSDWRKIPHHLFRAVFHKRPSQLDGLKKSKTDSTFLIQSESNTSPLPTTIATPTPQKLLLQNKSQFDPLRVRILVDDTEDVSLWSQNANLFDLSVESNMPLDRIKYFTPIWKSNVLQEKNIPLTK